MITYSNKVIVNGMSSKLCISSLLYASDISHHMSILFLNNKERGGDAITAERYTWEHKAKRPNIHTLPIVCPVCHVVQSWCPAASVSRKDGAPFILPCITKISKDSAKAICHGSYEFDACPPGVCILGPYIGTWCLHNVDKDMAQDEDMMVKDMVEVD